MRRKLATGPKFSRRPQPNRLRRNAGQKKKGQNERQPGMVSDKLRRRMGDALADIFNDFGPDIYAETVTGIKDAILSAFKGGFEQLDQQVKEELGRRGVGESREHVRNWANELVEDINHLGLDEAAAALEDFVGTLTAEYVQGDDEDDLLEVTEDEIEDPEVVEEEEIEPVEPEDDDGEEDVVDLGDLGLEIDESAETGEETAGSFGPTGGRRRRWRPRRHYR